MERLPIDDVLPDLIAALQKHSNAVLSAPPGAGKSTRVPPAILRQIVQTNATTDGKQRNGKQPAGRVILLQPRRLAARSVAARIADEQRWTLGNEVGYHVRFERKFNNSTQLLVMTDGMFLQLMHDNPWLTGIAAVLFDEFHERNLNGDLSLALCRRIQQEVSPDLRLLVMSATLAAAPVTNFLGDCPLVESSGRTFPVAIQQQKFPDSRPVAQRIKEQLQLLLPTIDGNTLVFLPGVGEIKQASREIESLAVTHDAEVYELYGEMSLEQQAATLVPAANRKIILATNVAETSLTIPGVTAVIDSGLARVLRQDRATGLNRLEIERISKASAAQRAGRAGRTAPGVCVRLWTESEQRGLADFDTPEIQRVELSGAVLELLAWGEPDASEFPWYEPPARESLDMALAQLHSLGAIDHAQQITELGKRLVQLPLQPRIARLMLAGVDAGLATEAATLAALLSERDPVEHLCHATGGQRNAGRGHASQKIKHHSNSDLLDRFLAIEEWESSKQADTWLGRLNVQSARGIVRVRDQLLKQTNEPATNYELDEQTEDKLMQMVLLAYPDRVARRREKLSPRATMVGGRGVRLAEQSAVRDDEFFVCLDLQETGGSETLVRQASAIKPQWLNNDLIREVDEMTYDAERKRVVQLRRRYYEDLVIQESPVNITAEWRDAAATMLATAVAPEWEQILEMDDATKQFEARWQCVREWLPDLELPPLDTAFWQKLLPVICQGCTSVAELRAKSLVNFLREQLTFQQRQAIDKEAPEKMAVPSGSQITLEYAVGKPPVLAVRVQELFGLPETPRIARGRVRVQLHLLGPNFRPQQVTDDLASFWKNTYPEVKKELKRRYPKHSWPDDPLTAPAQAKGSGKRR